MSPLYLYAILLCSLIIGLHSGCAPKLPKPTNTDAVSSNSAVSDATPVILSPVEIDSKDDQMQIALSGSLPFTFTFENDDNPPRLMVDVPQAQVEQPETRQVERGGIQSVQLRPLPGPEQIVRLEIELDDRASYRLSKEPKRLLIGIQSHASASAEVGSRGGRAVSNSDASSAEAQQSKIAGLAPTKAESPDGLPESVLPEFREYRIGPGDELSIEVYGEPELTKPYVVSEGGSVVFQYVGSIAVAGLTTSEVASALKRALSPTYVLNPQVSVVVSRYKSQRVFVVGAISPATFTLRNDTTLIEILSQLDGIESNSHVLVYRLDRAAAQNSRTAQGYGKEAIRVDLDRLLRQGDMSLNFILQPRDVIVVPTATRQGGSLVFVVGATRPRTFTLQSGMTLIEILSQLDDLETRTHILLYRQAVRGGEAADSGADAAPTRVDLNRLLRQGDMSLNLVLEPRDVIYLPDTSQGGVISNSITVFGEVKRPGPIELPETGMTIVDAIAEAGGFGQWAAPSRTRVLRMQDGKERTIIVNVSAVMRGKLRQNIELKPNDVIVVPERGLF